MDENAKCLKMRANPWAIPIAEAIPMLDGVDGRGSKGGGLAVLCAEHGISNGEDVEVHAGATPTRDFVRILSELSRILVLQDEVRC